jgi:nitrogen regulatory protein P-II 1
LAGFAATTDLTGAVAIGGVVMKEIKAYIRRDEIDEVVEALRAAGAPGVSVIEIHPVGYGYEPSGFEPRAARLVQRYRYLRVVKLEIMCADHQLQRLLHALQAHCRAGAPGDGMIFVSEIADAIRIRDGVRAEDALNPSGHETVPREAWTKQKAAAG